MSTFLRKTVVRFDDAMERAMKRVAAFTEDPLRMARNAMKARQSSTDASDKAFPRSIRHHSKKRVPSRV